MNKLFSFFIGTLLLVLVAILSPIIILFLAFLAVYSSVLYLLVWICWIPKGKDILFVYSDSPRSRDYVRKEIIPKIEDRAVILNWSERKQWSSKYSLQVMLFKRFGGSREMNPMGLYFRPFRLVKTYRFMRAFRDYKHGKNQPLEDLKNQFFADIGIANGL